MYDDGFIFVTENDAEQITDKLLTDKELKRMANSNGYETEEKEFDAYVENFKSLEQEDGVAGLEDINTIYDAFGGRDEYWTLIKEPLMGGMTIRKYLDSLKKQYAERRTQNKV